ncbi:CGEA protein [Bacillus pseudomycoides]|uniref:CGEA protein n=1 Tax=Bacillus pseudomycoides TaxID=64104 RepID=UPI001FB3074E|nr:CGEA protein [Bacillus pseudomycoides]
MDPTCEGSICLLASGIQHGTTVTVVGKSGFVYGPALFISFNPATCLVTLQDQDLLTPSVTNFIQIGCDNIESIITSVG